MIVAVDSSALAYFINHTTKTRGGKGRKKKRKLMWALTKTTDSWTTCLSVSQVAVTVIELAGRHTDQNQKIQSREQIKSSY